MKVPDINWRIGGLGGLLMVALLSSNISYGGEPWVRIEEDWELQLGQPDAQSNSPQLTIYLTPDINELETYFQLQLNHAAESGFSGGGFRVSAYSGDVPVNEARSETRDLFSFKDDVVTWTNVLAIRHGQLYFAVKDGISQSWGAFGGPEYLLQMSAGVHEDLSRYTPRQSVSDVDIGFGRNRVQKLTLKRIRAYREDGTFVTVDAMLDAFSLDSLASN